MHADEFRFLFAYDRWATRQVLSALDRAPSHLWVADGASDRGLGQIFVHQLGAAQRWRTAFQTQGQGEGPRPEDEPLPSIDELRRAWGAEWAEVDAWLAGLSDEFVAIVFDGVPVWQMLVHLLNHGTQHRSEAALILTAEGCSPGELDLIDYAEAVKSS